MNKAAMGSSRMRMRMRMVVVVIMVVVLVLGRVEKAEGVWCVAKSGATEEELQKGLDYACAAGADCNSLQPDGLCFLPNTLQAHASYAFNSFFQRSHSSPSSCDFGGSATLAQTDPSYGSCVYPSSPRTAGSITSTSGATPTSTSATPTTTTPPTSIDNTGGSSGSGSGSGLNPNTMGPPIPTTTDSTTSLPISAASNILLFTIPLLLTIF